MKNENTNKTKLFVEVSVISECIIIAGINNQFRGFGSIQEFLSEINNRFIDN